jgi:predicted Zn-dependent peptidase
MRDITELEKAEAQAMCDAVARQMKTRNKAEEADEAALTFSGQVNFSDNRPADNADFDFDEHNKKQKAETALFTIKRLVARSQSGVQDSIKKYLLQRNSTIAANKKKKEEAAKLHKNGWQST